MAVRCISPYRNGSGFWTLGQEIAGEDLEEWLLRDSPGSWERVKGSEPKAKAVQPDSDDSEPTDKSTEAAPEATKPIKPGRWPKKG